MKVLDLYCDQGHVFEGWFGSEADFQSQLTRSLVACPLCNSTAIHKGLSAPRLNLGAPAPRSAIPAGAQDPVPSASSAVPAGALANADSQTRLRALQAAWLQASRAIAARTEDVGSAFAEEARRIHRGDAEERGIRGQATPDQAQELLDEGIDVMPLALPVTSTETLQ